MTEESESILSAELVEELGGENASLVTTQKKKDKRKRSEDTEAVKLLAKKMSKSETKRFNQIQARKEKESKRADYLQVIKENQITDTQRLMITSTNDIGQTQTLKQLLSSLMRKQKAGLPLTEEESSLLFKQNDLSKTVNLEKVLKAYDMSFFDHRQGVESAQDTSMDTGGNDDEENKNETLFSFDSFAPPPKKATSNSSKSESITTKSSPTVEASEIPTTGKKGKKSSKVPAAPTIGNSMLAQLAALKNKLHTAAPPPSKKQRPSNSDDESGSEGSNEDSDSEDEVSLRRLLCVVDVLVWVTPLCAKLFVFSFLCLFSYYRTTLRPCWSLSLPLWRIPPPWSTTSRARGCTSLKR
jgi:hypothetical protein